jgi:hypothetical protein
MKVTRRGLIAGTATVLALGGAAATAASLPVLPAPRRWLVRRVIDRYVPGIVFEGEDLARFAEEVERMVLNRGQIGLRGVARYGGAVLFHDWPTLRDLLAPARVREDIDRRIINAFFRATDFWQAPYSPGRRITMVRSPDPYVSRCSNPVAVMASA